jgi:hypothetical protein
VINDKKLFFFHNYCNYRMQLYQQTFEQDFEKIMSSAVDGKVDVSQIVDMRKEVAKFYKDDKLDFNGFKSAFDDFMFREEENVGAVFDKANKFQTSVRGMKVRGVYDTKKEADIRAKTLQGLDPGFDVFVGQVGYWLPWDPTSTKVEDQEYQNVELNKLVKEYKANSVKKDQFYQSQKEERMKGAVSAEERAKHAAGLKATMEETRNMAAASKSSVAPTTSSISEIIEDAADASNVEASESAAVPAADVDHSTFSSSDPWMARKLEMQNSQQ